MEEQKVSPGLEDMSYRLPWALWQQLLQQQSADMDMRLR